MSSLPPSRISFLPLLFWIFILTTILFPQIYQPLLTSLWTTLYASSFYQLSTFETTLTVVSYAYIELRYTYIFARRPEWRIDVRSASTLEEKLVRDGNVGETFQDESVKKGLRQARGPKLPKMQRPHHRLREILVYVAPLLAMDLTMIKKFAGVPLNDIRVSGGYAPLSTPSSLEGGSYGFPSNTTATAGLIHPSFLLPTLHNITLNSPFQLTRALPPLAPTSRQLTLDLLASFLIYDTLFFLLHLSLHTVSFLSKIHTSHHSHAEMHPQITNRLSVLERLSLVLLANFSLNVIHAHVLSRSLFIPIFVELLVQVHCGMDLPRGYDKFLPRGWGLGGREHARHHRTGGGCYAPFFGWWDGGLQWCTRRSRGERDGGSRGVVKIE